MPTRVLVLGGGGREHALAWKLGREPGVNEVAGRARRARRSRGEPHVRVRPWTRSIRRRSWRSPGRRRPSSSSSGPRRRWRPASPTRCAAAGIAVFGPDREAARLETSKAFCHEVAAAAGVRTARARAFAARRGRRPPALRRASWRVGGAGVVLKADGLAAGKGVIVTELGRAGARARAVVPRGAARRTRPRSSSRSGSRVARRASSRSATGRGRSPCRRRATTSGCATATRARTRAAWAPTRRCRTSTTRRVERVLETVHRPILAEMARRGIAVPRLPLRGPDAHGRRPRAPRVQRPARRPRGPGDPAADRRRPRAAAARRRPRAPPGDAPARSPSCPRAAVGIVLAAERLPGRPAPRRPDRRARDGRGAGALVFHAGTVAAGRRAASARTAAGCSRSSARAATSPRPARRPSGPRTPIDVGRRSSAAATSPRTCRSRPGLGA